MMDAVRDWSVSIDRAMFNEGNVCTHEDFRKNMTVESDGEHEFANVMPIVFRNRQQYRNWGIAIMLNYVL